MQGFILGIYLGSILKANEKLTRVKGDVIKRRVRGSKVGGYKRDNNEHRDKGNREIRGEGDRELKDLHKLEKDGRIRDRIKAVLLYDKGYSTRERERERGEILLLTHEGIRKQLLDYKVESKLKPESGGRSSKLDEDQKIELIAHLKRYNYVQAKEIRNHIVNTYSIDCTVNGTIKLLKSLDFVYKKPKVGLLQIKFKNF